MIDDLQLKVTVNEGRSIVYRAIGRVENDFNEPAPSPEIRAVESRIVVKPALMEGLTGLEPGQQMMVIFYFHRSQGFDLLQHPQATGADPDVASLPCAARVVPTASASLWWIWWPWRGMRYECGGWMRSMARRCWISSRCDRIHILQAVVGMRGLFRQGGRECSRMDL